MMCERALSRETQGSILADKQMVQSDIADAYAELMQFRLLVLYTAWEIDRYHDYKRVRKNIATIKFLTPKVQESIVFKAMHLHGALGRVERDAVRQHVVGRADHGVGRRPERGAQGHRGQGSAEGLQARRRSVAVGVAAGEAGGGPQEDRATCSSTPSGTPDEQTAVRGRGPRVTNAFFDVRVVDLSVAPGGALAAMHLGEYGADVTRVELRPDDAAPDEPLWRYANRTKKVVVGSDDGLSRSCRHTADVVVVDLPASRARSCGARRRAAPAAQPLADPRVDAAARGARARPPICRTTSSCCGRGPAWPRSSPVRPATTPWRRWCRSSPTSRARSARARSRRRWSSAGSTRWCARSRCRDSTRSTR